MATKPHPAHLSPCVLELSGEDVTDSGSKYKHVYDIELREGGSVVGKSGKSVIKDGAWDHEGNVRSLATSPGSGASALHVRLGSRSCFGEFLACSPDLLRLSGQRWVVGPRGEGALLCPCRRSRRFVLRIRHGDILVSSLLVGQSSSDSSVIYRYEGRIAGARFEGRYVHRGAYTRLPLTLVPDSVSRQVVLEGSCAPFRLFREIQP
jgi:hypothetical protein